MVDEPNTQAVAMGLTHAIATIATALRWANDPMFNKKETLDLLRHAVSHMEEVMADLR